MILTQGLHIFLYWSETVNTHSQHYIMFLITFFKQEIGKAATKLTYIFHQGCLVWQIDLISASCGVTYLHKVGLEIMLI